jgi:DNA-binding CsgD family transcriptional regulator/MFS family permease
MPHVNELLVHIGHVLKDVFAGLRGCFDRRLFSFGLFQTWLFLVFHSSRIISFESSAFSLVYSSTLIFAVLTLVIEACLKYHRKARIRILVLGTICSVLSMVGLCFLPLRMPELLVSSALLGVGVSVFIPFVGKVFSSVDLETATRQTFLSFLFAVLLYFLILGLPDIAGTIAIVLLPVILSIVILSVVLFAQRSLRSKAEHVERDEVREMVRSRPLILFFLGVALLGVAFGFTLTFCSRYGSLVFNFSNRWAVFLTGVLAVFYCLFACTPKRPFDFARYFSPVMPLIVIGLLIFSYSPSYSSVITIAGFQLADMVIWIVFTWIAGHSGLPQRVFCIGKGSMYGGMLIGSGAVHLATSNPQFGSLPLIVVSLVAYLLILAIVFIFNNSKVNLVIKATSSNFDLGYITRAIELRCEELGQKYGLTTREKEILGYLAQGRSLPYLEESMHISHGTASSHRDHIYSKMGIHTKQELLDSFFTPP